MGRCIRPLHPEGRRRRILRVRSGECQLFQFRLLAAALFFLALTDAALADRSAMPAELDAALAAAERTPDLKLSFTLRFQWPDAADITQRFDATTKSWTTLEGDPGSMSAAARKAFDVVKRTESKPGGLLYADFRPYLKDVELVEETDRQAVFSFSSPEADRVSSEARESIEARLVLDRESGLLTRYSVRALSPFRPLPVARIDEYIYELDFEPLAAGGPAVMTQIRKLAKGRRLGARVDEQYTALFSDFAIVE